MDANELLGGFSQEIKAMIDWVTAKITCTHNPEILSSGRSIRTKKLMVLNTLNTKFCNRLSVKGSHDSNITIRSHTDSTIEISRVILQKFYRVM